LFYVGRVLAEYEKKSEWRKAARAYYLATFEKMNQTNIGLDAKVKTDQSTVSKLIKQMRGELSRLAGRDYELFTAERLKTAGYDVKLGGRVSEPDIIAKMGTVHKVYSCKCLDYQRKTTISANEFRPEIQYALANGARMVLAIHNLHDSTDKYMEMDANDFPKIITLIP
jgi:Holliday junction resolvase